jgi:hypothetical protein
VPILAVHNCLLAKVPWAKPLVLVIDGLDECDDKDRMAQLIQTIINAFQEKRGLPVRVFCTSRIEEHLRSKLEAPTVYALDLQDFDARGDIRKFFQSRFSTIRRENRPMGNIPLPWPSDEDIEALVQKSEGSFIFADTLVNFINDGLELPHRKIQKALVETSGLDTLYSQVLSEVPRGNNIKRVVGTVMLLGEPLSITYLGYLLQLDAADVLQALLGLQSILLIPADDNQPVRLFHSSLRDFLMSQPRSETFFIDPPNLHFRIATDCLTAMVTKPSNGVYEGEQEYACLNWCEHLLRGVTNCRDDNLFNQPLEVALQTFMSVSLGFWVDTLIFKSIPRNCRVLGWIRSRLQVG